MIPLHDMKQAITFKVKDKVTPVYYKGMMETLEHIHEKQDENGLSLFLQLIQRITSLTVPAQQAINHFISEVAYLVHGDEYSWLMLQKLDRVKQKHPQMKV